jgi:hypothetical protein
LIGLALKRSRPGYTVALVDGSEVRQELSALSDTESELPRIVALAQAQRHVSTNNPEALATWSGLGFHESGRR